jgi:hypothetical protein
MAKKRIRFTIEVGDDDFYFKFGRVMTDTQIREVCERRIKGLQSEIFPGLRLRSKLDGRLLKPKLQVVLVPAEET